MLHVDKGLFPPAFHLIQWQFPWGTRDKSFGVWGCCLSCGTVMVTLGGPDSPCALPPPELPLEVLSTMRCYVRHFFGCQECAEHFEAMAAKSMDKVASREEAILWLWSHHNEVNARLAGKGGCHRGDRGKKGR